MLELYRALIGGDPAYLVPSAEPALSTNRVLAMEFVTGRPIEALEQEPPSARDTAATSLMGLVLRELLVWSVMQTDPNFANHRWQPESRRLVLLDFGAARPILPETQAGYHRLLKAGLDNDGDRVREAAIALGFLGTAAVERRRPTVERMIDTILAKANHDAPFDFGDRAFLQVVWEEAMGRRRIGPPGTFPPADALFVQRKVSGTALLCARLTALVDVRAMVGAYRHQPPAQKA